MAQGKLKALGDEVSRDRKASGGLCCTFGAFSFVECGVLRRSRLFILFLALVLVPPFVSLIPTSRAWAAGPAVARSVGSALSTLAIQKGKKSAKASKSSRKVAARSKAGQELAASKRSLSRVAHRTASSRRKTFSRVRSIKSATVQSASVKAEGTASQAADSSAANNSLLGVQFVRPRSSVAPEIAIQASGLPLVESVGTLLAAMDSTGRVRDGAGNSLTLTVDPAMQQVAETLLVRHGVPWGALVAMDPHSGAIKAIASFSANEPNGPEVATRGGFPAASLFKMITGAAAVERAGLSGEDPVSFRGGNYTLGPANYLPDAKRDRRVMSLAEAMGRSCNPVFARVALTSFSPQMLERYAEKFGFNQELPFDAPIAMSTFARPDDHYEFARTAAGFGEVTITPVHAASVMSAISNGGVMMRPHLISRITDASGKAVYVARQTAVRGVVRPETAHELLSMMRSTVEVGTARKHFRKSVLSNLPIAGKTGTLSGSNPRGVYHWFVASIPANAPELTISVLVIDPGYSRANSVQIGRQFFEKVYSSKPLPVEATQDTERSSVAEEQGVS